MAEQETLHDGPTFDPAAHGLWQRFVDSGRINHGAWLRACASAEFVGTCRQCGAFVKPHPPEDLGDGRVDYEGVCVQCGQQMCAPGGRLPGTAQREIAAQRRAQRQQSGKGIKPT